MVDLKKETARQLTSLGISEEITFRLFTVGLIDDRTAKKYLVRNEYTNNNPCKGHKSALKEQIADRFCISPETVTDYIRKM